MRLSANIFDVWVFRRRGGVVEFLLLYTSVAKATRYFNGGRFWQIPGNLVNDGESITEAISRVVDRYGLRPKAIWAECAWLSYEQCLERVHYRGLKDGVRSVHAYITGVEEPARELCLYGAPRG